MEWNGNGNGMAKDFCQSDRRTDFWDNGGKWDNDGHCHPLQNQSTLSHFTQYEWTISTLMKRSMNGNSLWTLKIRRWKLKKIENKSIWNASWQIWINFTFLIENVAMRRVGSSYQRFSIETHLPRAIKVNRFDANPTISTPTNGKKIKKKKMIWRQDGSKSYGWARTWSEIGQNLVEWLRDTTLTTRQQRNGHG